MLVEFDQLHGAHVQRGAPSVSFFFVVFAIRCECFSYLTKAYNKLSRGIPTVDTHKHTHKPNLILIFSSVILCFRKSSLQTLPALEINQTYLNFVDVWFLVFVLFVQKNVGQWCLTETRNLLNVNGCNA